MSCAAAVVRIRGHQVNLHDRRLLSDDGDPVELRPQALDLLCELARHAGEVVSKRELFDRVWPGMVVTDDSLVQAVGDIRRAIGDDRHAVVQTVPRRGYRLVSIDDGSPATGAGVMADELPPVPAAEAVPSVARELGGRRRGLALAGTLGAVAALLVAWRAWHPDGGARAVPAPDRPPIAVLDFADPASSPEERQLARAYAAELAGELSRNMDLRVISATSSLAIDPHQPAKAIGERLHAAYLVNGSVHREGDKLRLLAHLVEAAEGRVVWTERQDIDAAGVYTLRDALVRRIAGSLHATMRGNEKARALQKPPESLDVYALTLRAIALKHRFAPRDNAEARRLLEQVLSLDPGYAPGWVYLGMVNGIDYANRFSGPARREMLDLAIEQLERGIALDPHLAAGYLGLSFIYPYAGRLEESIRAGRRCLELAPSDSECASFLALHLMFAGNIDEAYALARSAMASNPVPPSYINMMHGAVLWATGRLDEAIGTYTHCLQQSPRYVNCRLQRMLVLAEAGRAEEARADLREVRRGFQGDSIEAWIRLRFGPRAAGLMERWLAAWHRIEEADAVALR